LCGVGLAALTANIMHNHTHFHLDGARLPNSGSAMVILRHVDRALRWTFTFFGVSLVLCIHQVLGSASSLRSTPGSSQSYSTGLYGHCKQSQCGSCSRSQSRLNSDGGLPLQGSECCRIW
jgi:hypothetical protein